LRRNSPRCARPTRKSKTLLLAAYARRRGGQENNALHCSVLAQRADVELLTL